MKYLASIFLVLITLTSLGNDFEEDYSPVEAIRQEEEGLKFTPLKTTLMSKEEVAGVYALHPDVDYEEVLEILNMSEQELKNFAQEKHYCCRHENGKHMKCRTSSEHRCERNSDKGCYWDC